MKLPPALLTSFFILAIGADIYAVAEVYTRIPATSVTWSIAGLDVVCAILWLVCAGIHVTKIEVYTALLTINLLSLSAIATEQYTLSFLVHYLTGLPIHAFYFIKIAKARHMSAMEEYINATEST